MRPIASQGYADGFDTFGASSSEFGQICSELGHNSTNVGQMHCKSGQHRPKLAKCWSKFGNISPHLATVGRQSARLCIRPSFGQIWPTLAKSRPTNGKFRVKPCQPWANSGRHWPESGQANFGQNWANIGQARQIWQGPRPLGARAAHGLIVGVASRLRRGHRFLGKRRWDASLQATVDREGEALAESRTSWAAFGSHFVSCVLVQKRRDEILPDTASPE